MSEFKIQERKVTEKKQKKTEQDVGCTIDQKKEERKKKYVLFLVTFFYTGKRNFTKEFHTDSLMLFIKICDSSP